MKIPILRERIESLEDELLTLRLQKLEQQPQLLEKKQRREPQETLMVQDSTYAAQRPWRPGRGEERSQKKSGPWNPFLQENVPQAHLPSRNLRVLVPMSHVVDGSGEKGPLLQALGAAHNQLNCFPVSRPSWIPNNSDLVLEEVSLEDVVLAIQPPQRGIRRQGWSTSSKPGTYAKEGESQDVTGTQKEPSLDPTSGTNPDEIHGNVASYNTEGGTVQMKNDEDVKKKTEVTAKNEASMSAVTKVQEAKVQEDRRGIDIHNTWCMTHSRPPTPGPRLREDKRAYMMLPAPMNHTVQCRVIRNNRGVDKSIFPSYYLYLEAPEGRLHFLLAARKRKKSTTTNYVISLNPKDLSRNGSNFVGKVRSNVLGTKYTIVDNGVTPDSNSWIPENVRIREELGVVCYDTNILGILGPRKMTVILPGMDNSKQRMRFHPLNDQDTLLGRYQRGLKNNLILLRNKAPSWSEDSCAYVLNFHGRVTRASIKNFQITLPNDPEYMVLQFGRVSRNIFTMDFRYPLCPLQAFAICLTSFDGKLACE